MQYTLRNVPENLDQELRQRAKREGKSLNEVALEALARGAGISGELVRHRNLNDIARTWKKDVKVDRALEDQRRIDPDLWR